MSAAGIPVPCVDVRELQDLVPVIGIFKKRGAGTDHGTACYRNVFPFDAEHIRTAVVCHIEGDSFNDKAACNVIRDYGRGKKTRLQTGGTPGGCSGIQLFYCLFFGLGISPGGTFRDGRIKHIRNGISDGHFFFIKGYF